MVAKESQFIAPGEPLPVAGYEAHKRARADRCLKTLPGPRALHEFGQVAGDERVSGAYGIEGFDGQCFLPENLAVDECQGADSAQLDDHLAGAHGSDASGGLFGVAHCSDGEFGLLKAGEDDVHARDDLPVGTSGGLSVPELAAVVQVEVNGNARRAGRGDGENEGWQRLVGRAPE